MREYLLVVLVAAAVTYLATVVARELALRWGAVAKVRGRDVHVTPIPYFGGMAMLVGIVAAYAVARQLPFLSYRGSESMFRDAGVVVLAGAVICLVGIADDLWEISPLMKAGAQVLVASGLVLSNVQFYSVPLPGGGIFVMDELQGALLTVIIVVVTVNAVNFVDGLDGLAAGMVAIGAVAFFSYSFSLAVVNGETRAIAAALLTAALAGACAGILPHNFFPARMFIGDSGSMLIGFVLACSSISLTGQFPATSLSEGVGGGAASFLPALLPLFLPFAILIVPFVDLGLAVVRRTRAGRSPFSPDKMHIHHRLLEIGHSHRRAVLLMYAAAGLVAFGSVVVSLFSGWQSLVGFGLLAVLTAAAVFVLPRLDERMWR